MNYYLAYHLFNSPKKGRRIAFIDEQDIKEFTRKQFNPNKMRFTGARITADNMEEAKRIYDHPTEGEVSYVEEPPLTAVRSKVAALLDKIEERSIDAMTTVLGRQTAQINNTISVIVRHIYNMTMKQQGGSFLTEKELYDKLKQSTIKTLKESSYNDGSEEATGNDDHE